MSQTEERPGSPAREGQTAEAELLPEQFAALLRQMGSPEVLSDSIAPLLPPGGIRDARGLGQFLTHYQTQILDAVELPAIVRAHRMAARGHIRDLLALDQEIAGQPLLAPLASASRRIGRLQLESLRPLRDERVVQRYLAAVETGQAQGWHTVVYGITFAVYSWPLRHALLTYGREILSGLGQAASRSSGFSAELCGQTLDPILLRLPPAIEQTLRDLDKGGASEASPQAF